MYVTAALGHLLRCSSVSGREKASGGQSHDTECPSHVSTMGCWGKKKLLVIMTSLCACAAFASLCIAVATDYWLYAIEKIKHPNGSVSYNKTFSGLWRQCWDDGRYTKSHLTTFINTPVPHSTRASPTYMHQMIDFRPSYLLHALSNPAHLNTGRYRVRMLASPILGTVLGGPTL